MFFTRRVLYDVMRNSGKNNMEDHIKFLKEFVQKRTNCRKYLNSGVSKKLSYFVADFKRSGWSPTEKRNDSSKQVKIGSKRA